MPASLRTFATTFVADDQVVLEAATNMWAIVDLLERHAVGSSSQELGQGRGGVLSPTSALRRGVDRVRAEDTPTA